MTQPSWTAKDTLFEQDRPNRLPFIIVAATLFTLIGILIWRAANTQGQFYLTLAEYHANPTAYTDRDLRIGAVVLGDTIQYTQLDAEHSRLEFTIADSANNPTQTLRVVVLDEEKPDLLQNEAQALVEGRVGTDGLFYTNPGGLLLKCPTRYEAEQP